MKKAAQKRNILNSYFQIVLFYFDLVLFSTSIFLLSFEYISYFDLVLNI